MGHYGLSTFEISKIIELNRINMNKPKNWIEYYDLKAMESNNPLEISDMHLGNELANQAFLESEKFRLKALLQIDIKKSDNHLLDLGCSVGICTGLLKEFFNQTTGVDLSEKSLEIARQRIEGVTFLVDNITELSKLPILEYTHILSYGVLQFLNDLEIIAFFEALARISKRGTRIVISRVPNKDFYGAYQDYRDSRNLVRTRIVSDELKWNFISPDFVADHTRNSFELILILPLIQLDMPLKAFFDFVLIKK